MPYKIDEMSPIFCNITPQYAAGRDLIYKEGIISDRV